MICAEPPELKPPHDLPASWSHPTSGVECKMTELAPSDSEFMEVEGNARKTSGDSLKRIVSVSADL